MFQSNKSVVESEEIIQYIHPRLLKVDYESYVVKMAIILSAVLAFCVIYVISSLLFSFNDTYIRLRSKEKIFWHLAIVRACFGVFASIIGAWSIFIFSNHHRDVVFGQTATGSFAMNVTVGFFLFECLALTASDTFFGTLSRLLHIHHWFCVAGGARVVFSEVGYGISLMALALEMSTPFSALCWILLKVGMGDTKLWTVNQMILLHTFHLRSVVECYIWWVTYKEWSAIWTSMPWLSFILIYTVLTLFTFVATPYWAYKKTMQLLQPADWNFEIAAAARNPNSNGNAHKME